MGGYFFLCVVLLQLSGPLQVALAGTSPLRCKFGTTLCSDGSECILYNHLCDGEPDCKDGSDEENCASICNEDQFQCAHGKKCIEQSQVCDGVSQCRDHSDELECFKPTKACAHQCGDKNRCIPSSFICDGERDCLDGSDEANCGVEVCSASDFKCTSGECVSDKVRCDGYPDCQDHSDEEKCLKPPVCITKQRCPQSKECLVQEWICDGHQDCKDGTDEKDCPVPQITCGEFQWSCKSKTKCIPTAWRCDDMMDCDDGTDEAECDMEGCLPHLFQCDDGECLDPVLVCNGFPNCADGSDEGGSCQIKCTDEDNGCSQTCYSTPQGTSCGCGPGYRLAEDGFTCVDIDECEGQSPGVCSQICANTPGSYQCDCHPGYVMETNGHNCKIIGEPLLLSSVLNDLFLIGLHSGRVDVLSSSAEKAILSLDYDWKEQRVFWDSLDTASIGWSSLEQKTTGTLIKGVRADSVAVDWLGRNLYWIDGVNSQIVAIKLPTATVNSLDQSIILDEDLDQPRSLALLPQKGLMFWTEIGNAVKIERAGMDGSERRAVVNSSLGWPGGVTVDPMSDRVYWTDVRLRAIGSATLDGDDIKILQMKEIANPFSLAVFNDMLYWSDSKKRMVQAAHKITGKKRRVLLKRLRQPFALKIIHPQLQMEAENPCEKRDCSHLCSLAPGPTAVCKCPSGLLLAEDGLTCSSLVNSAFLLMQSSSTITQIYLQSRHTASDLKGWPEHVALQLPSIKAAILDYNLRDHTLYLTDDSTTSLSSFKLQESNLTSHSELLKLLGDTITAMALDWVTLNMYWSSNKQQRLQVSSFTDAWTTVVIKDGIGRIESIVLHPQSGRVCFTNLVLTGTDTVVTVECADMDGAERSVVWKDGVRPTSLVFSSSGESIYWADTSLGTIGSIQLNDHKYSELKVGDGLAAVALSDYLLLWMTVSDKTRLWYRDEHQQSKLWFEVGSEVISLKAFSKSSQTGSNQCSHNNGNCQHLCLATPGGRTCRCTHDHVLVNETLCSPDQQHCPAGSRMCLDGLSCQPVGKFCNGHVDCTDHSDENCFSVEQRSGDAPGPTQPQSSASPLPSLPSVSEEPGLTTTLNISIQLTDLDVKECSERRCSGRGQCVEVDGKTACVCSLLYSGDSCQDHLLKSMKSPVVYGAAACVLLVVIAVIAVVLKKKKGNSRRANPEKETNMTNLEKKAESTPSTQTAPAGADKPEEVVSSVD
ncbi:prolow-density lipoprotein receptor-related protein 1 [Sphaeramia orbicularis]|uniref:prolow-density lipoprotein receptor-related protein 1 n=1 Tax=Sphaeramia orbicularis TaxID=375764 RepID=UPI00117D4FAA|nr:prolow-density lipoprotein receptor-related protein 1-like [Sphaeramia orbicularis]